MEDAEKRIEDTSNNRSLHAMEKTDHMDEDTASNSRKDDSLFVDHILRSLNPIGRYQVLHILALLMSSPTTAFHLFSTVFTAKDVPHRCAGPPEGSEWSDIFGDTGNLTIVQDKCRLSLTDNSSVLDSTTCVYGHEYELPLDASYISQFDLVCDLKWLTKLSQTVVILGQGVGALITSFVSDRFGRKTTLVCSNLGLLATGLGVAFSPNAPTLIVFKFLTGIFQQGTIMSRITFFLELLPLEYRTTNAWLGGTVWGLSAVLFSLIAYIFRNDSWQSLQIVLSLASLTAFIQWWYMDESLRWLLANGKTEKAQKTIARIAKVNGRNADQIMQQFHLEETEAMIKRRKEKEAGADGFEIEPTEHLSLIDILKVKRLLINSLCLWFGWFIAALSFFIIYLTSTSLSGNPYLNFALTALMEIPNNLFHYLCLNRLGRRRCLRILFLTLGVGIMLAGLSRKLEEKNSSFATFTLLASMVAMIGASGSLGLMFSYSPEMYPTNMRQADEAVWAPGLVIGIGACAMCLLSYFLPETNGRELPQTLPQLQAWFKETEGVESINKKKAASSSNGGTK
ncbi:solute carrier family 22 member 6-a [Plakobranchus ocellatus]|uniref:Solute carrier family 22 member 6-a n=1 Tax=Plakobranchus ocellatus TaxID=259542 RepID=A0AAV4DE32_9GAST|nr:solute carrier family 22 member 6-a [Plakobranchus ocellatus]